MKTENHNQLDANKYFIVYKIALNIKNLKLTEICLKTI